MKVSCVMPTGNRRDFISSAIRCFLDQTFTDTELVILDDGDEPCHNEAFVHERIRYVYEPGARLNTGAKRNRTNALAQGEILINWDDDDWSHPNRITNQLAFMENAGKPVVGYHMLYYWRIADQKVFQYVDPTFRPHCAGSSLCYRRDFWEKHPYPSRSTAEDFLFEVAALRNRNLASESGLEMLVARVHGANTSNPKFGSRTFPEVTVSCLPPLFRAML